MIYESRAAEDFGDAESDLETIDRENSMTFEESIVESLNKISAALIMMPTSVPQQMAAQEAVDSIQETTNILRNENGNTTTRTGRTT